MIFCIFRNACSARTRDKLLDSYLEIAEKVLKVARQPMSPKAILEAAYRGNIVPDHLHGKTQHKTLQARLSEDILRSHGRGRFYRTAPGFFFLKELEADPEIPDQYKMRFAARRRTRDLFREPALSLKREFLEKYERNSFDDWSKFFKEASAVGATKYIYPRMQEEDYLPVWSFSIARKKSLILSYRVGRYRDDRDLFANRRTIGFPSLVSQFDQTLFSSEDMGVTESGLNAISTDLDLSTNWFSQGEKVAGPSYSFGLYVISEKEAPALLFVVEWICPDWFEPTARKLSLNDVRWMDFSAPPNNIDDFEPWSKATIEALQKKQLA